METVPGKRTAPEVADAARRYANLLAGLDYVEMVLLEDVGWEVPRLWTVLSSPAFEDRYTDPVYEAQAAIIDALSRPVFDFRVINVNELQGYRAEVLPADGEILYERPVRA